MRFNEIIIILLSGILAFGQTPPAPSAPPRKPATPVVTSPVDTVIQLLKGGMSESLIIRTLQRQNKAASLTPADMLKLQKAGVSENIIAALMDPASAPAVGNTAPSPPPPATATVGSSIPRSTAPAQSLDCPIPTAVSAAPGAQKRRLAVQAFDYSAVRTYVTGMFGSDINIGQGIRAILTAKMGQSKNVVLLEREKMGTILAEQDFGATNRVKQGTKAKVGNITGADAILLGDIVIFGRDDTGKKSGAGGFARALPGPFGGIGGAVASAKKTDKAVVAINLRIVDAETGEVIETAEARGESSRTSTDWGAVAGSWKGGAAAGSSMTSSNFQETIIGEATVDAVTKIAAFLDTKMPSIGVKARAIDGRVATIDGCTLYLSVGGNDGVHVGDRFEIARIVKEVIDPETKEVLDKQIVKVGEMIVATVRDKTSTGTYGGQPLSMDILAKPGYTARMVTQ